MADNRGFSSGKFALELGGKPAGFLTSVDGGGAIGSVVVDAATPDGIAKKHIGSVSFEPITIQFGVGMAQELYDWMAEMVDRGQKPRTGAIVFLNYDFTEVQRLEWKRGFITEIVFPPADGGSKDQAVFTVTIAPEAVTLVSSSGKAQPGFTTKTQKKLFSSNFRFSVTGLESASAKIRSVLGLSVRQPLVRGEGGVAARPGTLQVSNVLVTMALSSAQPWLDWVDEFLIKGKSDDDSERTAELQFLDPSMKDQLFTLTLLHAGPVRARRQKTLNGSDTIAQVEFELYCESLALKVSAKAAGSTVTDTSIPQSASTRSSGTASSMETTLALLAVAGGQLDAQRALRALQAGSLASSPELVAARLTARASTAGLAAAQRTRADGESLGEQWASEQASLAELKSIAELDGVDWSAIQLPDDHTFIAELGRIGVVPTGGVGPLQLSRDAFVEGVVAGAARVLRAAQPHLRDE